MDVGKAFGFVFEDKDWIVKLLIAAGILLVGILFFWVLLIPAIVAAALLAGYALEITRRVIRGQRDGLPEWDNWGELIVDGIKVLLISLVYALPAILVSLCLGLPAAAAAEDAEGLSVALNLFSSCLSIVWSILISVLLPAAIALFAATGDWTRAFRFGEVIALVRDNIGLYLITFLMSWVASFVGGLGVLVCGIGWLVTAPYAQFVTGHLYGQAYVEATGGATSFVAPVEPVAEDVLDLDDDEDIL
ncbi:MAG TPA: DUF4013 domain-containing protein [Anaerolineae bacterium]|nr:DUF4013 domain-containing protein [Anaerolineae bacterium]